MAQNYLNILKNNKKDSQVRTRYPQNLNKVPKMQLHSSQIGMFFGTFRSIPIVISNTDEKHFQNCFFPDKNVVKLAQCRAWIWMNISNLAAMRDLRYVFWEGKKYSATASSPKANRLFNEARMCASRGVAFSTKWSIMPGYPPLVCCDTSCRIYASLSYLHTRIARANDDDDSISYSVTTVKKHASNVDQ